MDNSANLQTILGAGGAIGKELAAALKVHKSDIRLVSRHPSKVNATDEVMAADICDPEQLERAVAGSDVVYLTVGFEYNIKVWREKWPPLMRNLLDACERHRARLVFFDNVYMYDRDRLDPMTESTPIRPTSQKGKVRAEIAQMVMDAVEKGSVTALIARSADFISQTNSILVELVYKNLIRGKRAQWQITADKVHNFTFAPDVGKATALLGNTPDAYNQVWHLPTDPGRLTGRMWIERMAEQLGADPKSRILPRWAMGLLGYMIPVVRELNEMAYQFDRDYFFDSSKFVTRFGEQPTPPDEAIRWVIEKTKK